MTGKTPVTRGIGDVMPDRRLHDARNLDARGWRNGPRLRVAIRRRTADVPEGLPREEGGPVFLPEGRKAGMHEGTGHLPSQPGCLALEGAVGLGSNPEGG